MLNRASLFSLAYAIVRQQATTEAPATPDIDTQHEHDGEAVVTDPTTSPNVRKLIPPKEKPENETAPTVEDDPEVPCDKSSSSESDHLDEDVDADVDADVEADNRQPEEASRRRIQKDSFEDSFDESFGEFDDNGEFSPVGEIDPEGDMFEDDKLSWGEFQKMDEFEPLKFDDHDDESSEFATAKHSSGGRRRRFRFDGRSYRFYGRSEAKARLEYRQRYGIYFGSQLSKRDKFYIGRFLLKKLGYYSKSIPRPVCWIDRRSRRHHNSTKCIDLEALILKIVLTFRRRYSIRRGESLFDETTLAEFGKKALDSLENWNLETFDIETLGGRVLAQLKEMDIVSQVTPQVKLSSLELHEIFEDGIREGSWIAEPLCFHKQENADKKCVEVSGIMELLQNMYDNTDMNEVLTIVPTMLLYKFLGLVGASVENPVMTSKWSSMMKSHYQGQSKETWPFLEVASHLWGEGNWAMMPICFYNPDKWVTKCVTPTDALSGIRGSEENESSQDNLMVELGNQMIKSIYSEEPTVKEWQKVHAFLKEDISLTKNDIGTLTEDDSAAIAEALLDITWEGLTMPTASSKIKEVAGILNQLLQTYPEKFAIFSPNFRSQESSAIPLESRNSATKKFKPLTWRIMPLIVSQLEDGIWNPQDVCFKDIGAPEIKCISLDELDHEARLRLKELTADKISHTKNAKN